MKSLIWAPILLFVCAVSQAQAVGVANIVDMSISNPTPTACVDGSVSAVSVYATYATPMNQGGEHC